MASVVVLRVTGWPVLSVPVSVRVTPNRPISAGSAMPLLSASSQTRPVMALLLGISPKLLALALAPGVVSTMPEMALGAVPAALAVPPAVPGTARPLRVPGGCVGSVTV